MNKNIIKSALFIIIFLILYYFIRKLLWLRPYSINYFYDEPKNSIDVIYIGGSNVSQYFNSTLAYHKYGYTTALLSTASQNFIFTKYCIKEGEKYQNPSLYIIDLTKVAESIYDITDEKIRITTDSMKFSKNRIDAINDILGYKENIDKSEYINHYFSFFMYHNSWKSISKDDLKLNILKKNDIYYKGYGCGEIAFEVTSQNPHYWSEDVSPLKKENEKILVDLINYIKASNLNVLFVVPIRNSYTYKKNKQINYAIKIIQENGLDVINFNTVEEFYNTIDFSNDFHDSAHFNVYGATKYTLYFSKYLKEYYELENHKGDKSYNSWETEYKRFKEHFYEKTNKNFDDLLLEYENN